MENQNKFLAKKKKKKKKVIDRKIQPLLPYYK